MPLLSMRGLLIGAYSGRSIGSLMAGASSSISIVSPVVPLAPELERAGLDPAQQIDHPPVLEPHLIVEEPPQLLGELPHRCLRPLLAASSQSKWTCCSRGSRSAVTAVDLVHPVQQTRPAPPAGLPIAGSRGMPGTTAALVGVGDRLAAAEHLVEQLALAALPAGDLSPAAAGRACGSSPPPRGSRPAAPGRSRRTAGTGRGRRWRRAPRVAGLDAGDLLVELVALRLQLGDPRPRVGLGAEHDLAQQLEDRVQPGLGADEVALAAAARPTAMPSPPPGVASKCGSSEPSG